MFSMGIKNVHGQLVLAFTCLQCKKQHVVDFRNYPICKKCDKFNNKDHIKAVEKAKKDKSYCNKLKRSMGYYEKNKTLCDLVCKLRDEEGYNLREVAEKITELGYKTETGVQWTAHMVFWMYKQKGRAEKIQQEVEKLEKGGENSWQTGKKLYNKSVGIRIYTWGVIRI